MPEKKVPHFKCGKDLKLKLNGPQINAHFFLVVKSIIFLVVFLFSLNNTHVTTINIFPGVADIAVDAPLIIWLLLFFFLGIVNSDFFLPKY